MARERRMYQRERRTLRLLEERGSVTADDLTDCLGMDRYRAYIWLRGVARQGYLYQAPDGSFSLACPLPAAGVSQQAA